MRTQNPAVKDSKTESAFIDDGDIRFIGSPEIVKTLKEEERIRILTLIYALKMPCTPSATEEEKVRAPMQVMGSSYLLHERYPKGITIDVLTKDSVDSGTLDKLNLSHGHIHFATMKVSALTHSTLFSRSPSSTSASTSTLSSTATSSSTSSASSTSPRPGTSKN